ncbi:M15 family metallopeptidase [Rheinheimera pleomorphica]|uniref:M15 family metallopeptidase n=1 Tax=Rheinheimera pleomorphica TaxID=2703963 RepID=UPI0014241170|nr:M15 family metallopeptidase [Rheinheimera pleomorphica]
MILCDEAVLTGLTERHLVLNAQGVKLHADVAEPFMALCAAARRDGIAISVASSFRSFERQAYIWQAKFNGKKPVFDHDGQRVPIEQLAGRAKLEAILLYSALPGASRHHWGTDLDLYDAAAVTESYQLQLTGQEYGPTGPFYGLATWLAQHARQFGFFLPYQHYQGGVAAEPWHLSYQPVAAQYLAQFSPELLRNCLIQHPIAGQSVVLQYLDSLYSRYISNICEVV